MSDYSDRAPTTAAALARAKAGKRLTIAQGRILAQDYLAACAQRERIRAERDQVQRRIDEIHQRFYQFIHQDLPPFRSVPPGDGPPETETETGAP